MIYSRTCEYAIRALIYFADHPQAPSASVKEVSGESGVPQSYVAKIFQCLAQSGILRSQRGPTGGYSLTTPVSKLSLLRIVQALDDPKRSAFSNCVMGLEKCNDKNPCPLHHIWSRAKEEMLDKLAAATLSDVAELGDKFRWGKQRRSMLSKRMREIFSV